MYGLRAEQMADHLGGGVNKNKNMGPRSARWGQVSSGSWGFLRLANP